MNIRQILDPNLGTNQIIEKLLENQAKFMRDHDGSVPEIPEAKPLYPGVESCKSCERCFPSNRKNIKYASHGDVRRCKVWGNMIIKDEIKCDFYSPIMISGFTQIVMETMKLVYPQLGNSHGNTSLKP
jgi:hypothetical protein